MISWAAKPFVTSKTTQHHQIPPKKHQKNHTAHFTFTIQKPQKKMGCELDCRDLNWIHLNSPGPYPDASKPVTLPTPRRTVMFQINQDAQSRYSLNILPELEDLS